MRTIRISQKGINKILTSSKKLEKNPTYLFVVAAALIRGDGKIFVQQRPESKAMAGLWEFPGGKVDAGETPEQALVRELQEELGISVCETALKPIAFASEPIDDRHLVLLLYLCEQWAGEPTDIEAAAMQWLPIGDLHTLDMPPADIPLVKQLKTIL